MKNYNLLTQKQSRNNFLSFYYIPLLILLILLAVASCGTTKQNVAENQKVKLVSDNDSTEYSLIVLDSGFESYLATKPSAHFYSQQYYEGWNSQYVREWNRRHRNPSQYRGSYDTEIDYNPRVDYGLELNYQLYYYFQFIKDKYGIELLGRGR